MKIVFRWIKALLAVALLGVLVLAALSWAPERPVAELSARWAPPPSQFIAIAGMQVHLRDEGPREDPSPIVLIHGTSASLHTWQGWTDALVAQRRVIRFDLPGFGLTGPAPAGDYSIDAYVRFVTAVLDRLEVPHCVLVGNSFGGQVAWSTALAVPERIDKLILVDSSGYVTLSTSVPVAFRIARNPYLAPLSEYFLPRATVAASLRNVYGDPDKVSDELIDRYYEITLRAGNRRAVAQRFAQILPGERSERIAQLKLPTLILWGGRDHLIPPDNALHFQRDIAGSQLQVFDDLGHVPQEEDPARSVAAAKVFLGLK
jgi:pimeloyl-ACP methyl ester carboxylesterase